MYRFLITLLALAAGAASLGAAARGIIDTRDGRNLPAISIEGESLHGVTWMAQRNQPGTRVEIWDVLHVRYDGQMFDQYNSMARKLTPAQSRRLEEDAQSYLREGEKPPAYMSEVEWTRVQLTCRFYVARALALQEKWPEAAEKFADYLKAAEDRPIDGPLAATFRSAISGREITKAGGLHRLYLDGLEGLGLAYMAMKEPVKANELAFKPLQNLGAALASRTNKGEYYSWAIRALRTIAINAEENKEFKAASDAWDSLFKMAQAKDSGRPSRAQYEAMLKVGYMKVKEGELNEARTRFFGPISRWEAGAHSEDSVSNPKPPQAGWISADIAYLTAGSYVGQGMIDAARANRAEDWASALTNFSMALAVFRSDEEVRGMALLGAAHASSMLAQVNAAKPDVANLHARLAEKYLTELTTEVSRASSTRSEAIPEIEARIAKFKKKE